MERVWFAAARACMDAGTARQADESGVRMRTFYNDFDKPACEWLGELCRRGLIADGVVHHGSIKDIKPDRKSVV